MNSLMVGPCVQALSEYHRRQRQRRSWPGGGKTCVMSLPQKGSSKPAGPTRLSNHPSLTLNRVPARLSSCS